MVRLSIQKAIQHQNNKPTYEIVDGESRLYFFNICTSIDLTCADMLNSRDFCAVHPVGGKEKHK